MNKLTGKTKGLLVLVSAMEILLAALGSAATYEGARMLQLAQAGDWHSAALTLAICLGLVAANALLDIGNMELKQTMYVGGIQHLRSSILGSMFSRPVRDFREKDDAYYMNLLTTDAQTFCAEFLGTVPLLVSWIARILAAAVMLYCLHPMLMVVSLLASALPLAAQNLFNKLSTKARNEYSASSEAFTAVMKETIQGYESIRMDDGCPYLLDRFRRSSLEERQRRKRSMMVASVSQTFFFTSASLVYLAGLGAGGWLIAAGKLDAVLMLAGVNWIVQISNGFGNVIEYATCIRSIGDIRRKLGRESEQTQTAAADIEADSLTYRNVSFSFGEQKLYENFSHSFCPGSCCALIGPSGSGKSTLTKLALKYYEDYRGQIFLGDRDIRDLTDETVYRQIGVLTQAPFLFNASLYDNITMFSGSPSRDSREYSDLLAKVNLAALAERVGDQPLGDFGDNISGGECQRICLARCLRQEKPICIFDEPTTGLDPENAGIIRRAIFGYTGAARIVITHDQWELEQFSEVLDLAVR